MKNIAIICIAIAVLAGFFVLPQMANRSTEISQEVLKLQNYKAVLYINSRPRLGDGLHCFVIDMRANKVTLQCRKISVLPTPTDVPVTLIPWTTDTPTPLPTPTEKPYP